MTQKLINKLSHSIDVIPRPTEVAMTGDFFVVAANTPIYVDLDASGAEPAVQFLKQHLNTAGRDSRSNLMREEGAIRLTCSPQPSDAEAYQLLIGSSGIEISASTAAGWFYGVQTLLQLLPMSSSQRGVPCGRIIDRPRFKWRGLMLDVSRHIMPIEGILRLLDNMAAYKLNTFHWHLNDDQGWRIESRRFPKLTEVGAWRAGADGALTPIGQTDEAPKVGRYGGYYTHDDVRRVVSYAAERHIQVIPEIEIPGHALAVLAAYPEFSCSGGPFEPAAYVGISKDVYCAGNEDALRFLEEVIDELLPLFLGEYIHIGGDECPKDRWKQCPKCQSRIRGEGLANEHELQSYVVRRLGKLLTRHGKKMIGWDEILEGGLAPGATVMCWRGTAGGITAARAGHDVVMTPLSNCYLDYQQAATGEPPTISAKVISLETVYSYDPVPTELTPKQAEHILGVQGNVWTEHMPDIQHVEYMIWPRATAIAEIGWSDLANRDWNDFRRRAKANEPRLAHSGSAFRPIPKSRRERIRGHVRNLVTRTIDDASLEQA